MHRPLHDPARGSRMKRSLCLLVLLAVASVTRAGGLNLSWDHCTADGGAVSNRTFACASDAGAEHLVGSFIPSIGTSFQRVALTVQFMSSGSSWPGWLFPGPCSGAALQPSGFDPATDVACHDWSQGVLPPVTVAGYSYPAGSTLRSKLTLGSDRGSPGS